MAERTYIALIETDTDGLSVSFPDLPGCVSGGDTLDHAVLMAKEALSLHLDGMVEDGQPLPDARSCLLYTSPSPRDVEESRMPSSA